jgi:hypothetical protein
MHSIADAIIDLRGFAGPADATGRDVVNMRWLLSCALICCQLALAEQSVPKLAQQSVPQKPADPLAEVEINAQREKLSAMRAEIVKLEDRFYTEYNKLNSDHQYDMVCTVEAPTGTILQSRKCQPAFVNTATRDEALGFLGGYSVPPASVVVNGKWPDYEKNMLGVINKHAELRKLIRERDALEKRYQAVRKQKLKGKFIVFD